MSLDEIKALTDIFGPGGGLIVMLGLLAVGFLIPPMRRERKAAKDDGGDLLNERDVLVFMAEHRVTMLDIKRRVERLERKIGD